MAEELISKKELLELTGISYGQLYRWKRKRLIPEEWFIKKSAFTGQETFFPKYEILDRIEKITSLKDQLSLDELAEMFSNKVDVEEVQEEVLIEENIVTQITLSLFLEVFLKKENYSFLEILVMHIVDKYIISGEIGMEEAKVIFNTFKGCADRLTDESGEIILVRKLGVTLCFIGIGGEETVVEDGVKVIIKEKFSRIKEELKLKR